ncbi:MAG: DUF4011 domain-containing protein [Proteobacteria bacterium]|nr:DUF4011 domain-containing protein [Pseudomonadota bacterium]
MDRRIHFALQQNDVPVIKSMTLENRSEAPLEDLLISISAEPEFARGWESRIARIEPGASFSLGVIDLGLSPGFLWDLTEPVRGWFRLSVRVGDRVLLERTETVDLLARNQWSGMCSLPEILAAFVMPNHPAVEQTLRKAADLLKDWTGDSSLSGYQTRDPNRCCQMAAAVYAALQTSGISYINPPAGFEEQGQRIRLPDQILSTRMATCLDMAVFAAGCLEQIGLHPLVVMVQGHAFTGVWLTEECFEEPCVEEPLRVRKRVDLKEILVLDPTCATMSPPQNFEFAIQEARRRLKNPAEYVAAVDVRRARIGKIRPLPEKAEQALETGDPAPASPGMPDRPAAPVIPQIPQAVAPGQPEGPEAPETRLEKWRRQLLDLTLRNRLLNFQETKKTIPLMCPEVEKLEDALADGAVFQVIPRPKEFSRTDPRDADAIRQRTGEDGLDEVLLSDMSARRLHADLTELELNKRLLDIYRAARTGLEEGGASALYLALGFLEWYESPSSEKARLAPILLLPLVLERKSVKEGFSLRLGEEEPLLNVTLLEMLKKDHGLVIQGLEPLPGDESGVDVPRVFRTFLEAVRDIDHSRWDVRQEARIGIFSFSKYLMWRDLTLRQDDLLKNKVVDHLVNRPGQDFEPGAAFPDPDRLDQERAPHDTFCPLPADSSQLAAVFAAEEGRSFVLEGPPGTGKSQTITNLIAHCLAKGKTVLFVSEKMAALGVVHHRLKEVGLDRHCLEIHSHKTRKQDVYAHLAQAMEQVSSRAPEDWRRQADGLEKLRGELNEYVEALHKRRETGESIFHAVSRLMGLRDVPRVELRWPSGQTVEADRLAELRELVDRLATAARGVGEPRGHAWEGAGRKEWTPTWEERVKKILARFLEYLNRFDSRAGEVAPLLSFGEGGWKWSELALMEELAGLLLESPDPGRELLARPDWESMEADITGWMERGQRRDALREEVFEAYEETILELDLDALKEKLDHANASWWPFSWWRRRPVKKALKSVAKSRKAPPKKELPGVLEIALELKEKAAALDSVRDEAEALVGRAWEAGEPNWERVETVLGWARRLRGLTARAAGSSVERVAKLRTAWASLVTDGRDLLKGDGELGRKLRDFRAAFQGVVDVQAETGNLLKLDAEKTWKPLEAEDSLTRTRKAATRWSENLLQLNAWCAWNRARAEALGQGLSALVEGYEAGAFGSRDFPRVFERNFYEWWYNGVVSREQVLSRFSSLDHQQKIERFRKLDEEFLKLTQALVTARLAEKVPDARAASMQGSHLGQLRREIGKRRRQMPVRKLFGHLPELLARLKPCLLMSPISVAQYLDAGYPPFDLVVFDEASQIPVWDAIGALARGRQAIIVGDPKQLPPTNFFQRTAGDDEEEYTEESVQDLESILEDAMASGLPPKTLNWHYRSRHESLIAFSNFHYYENRLLTFPSSFRDGMGVSWKHVPDGVYDRGKSATNRKEAQAVLTEIVRRVHDPELRKHSMGIVTFSQAQQTLIENLLEEERRKDPDLDGFFSDDMQEPIFVKNLENVQGDERDVIIFSICYGPDALGRVAMNFGPMNKDGGHRRLNVAITRARRELVVFSTLCADQIDLSRTRARGVEDLKRFLEYAEEGPSSFGKAIHFNPGADCDSPFEQEVYERLADKGYQVHKQVGCASYRIDLAIVDPEAPGRYILGIECDGANYHRAKTARDRDKLREGGLRGLGWNIHRIWSSDWWRNRGGEIQKVEEAYNKALRTKDIPVAKAEPMPVRPTQAGPFMSLPGLSATGVKSWRTPEIRSTPTLPVYKPFKIPQLHGGPEVFYDPMISLAVTEAAFKIVDCEGPICLPLLVRRLAGIWDVQKVTQKALKHVRNHLPRKRILVRPGNGEEVLWPLGMDPESYDGFRVPGEDPDSSRKAEEIPLAEISNAVHHLLKHNLSAPEEEVIRETARIFGFRRTGPKVEARMRLGIELLIQKGAAQREGGDIQFCK